MSFVERVRQLPGVVADDELGGFVQITPPAVIAQALPVFEYRILPRPSEFFNRGKAFHEPIEIRHNRGDLCLLEHDLRNPHRIWRAILTPRQITSIGMKPPK